MMFPDCSLVVKAVFICPCSSPLLSIAGKVLVVRVAPRTKRRQHLFIFFSRAFERSSV